MVAFNNNLPWPQYAFFQGSMWWFVFIIAFSSSFFVSGIICSDYKKKTGLMIIPLISRKQLFLGKFMANNVYVIGIAIIQYSIMYLTAFFYYGPPMINTPLISFCFVVLYLLALNALISFFSSFLPPPTYVIIIILALYFFGFTMIESLVQGINDSIEPLFSLSYIYNLIIQIIDPNYSLYFRYSEDPETGIIEWLFPTVDGALISLSLQFIIFILLTLYITDKKQI